MECAFKISELPQFAEARVVGLILCTNLREIGSRVKTVQPDISRLADRVQRHWRVLDLLSQRLDSREIIHNGKAMNLTQAILSCTLGVFRTIGTIIPSKDRQSLAYSLLVKQKMKAMCKKVPLDTLLNQLDFLRSTTQLVLTTLIIGEKIRWSRLFSRGRPTDKVAYETTRLDDKPAKYCLADNVVATLKTFSSECDAVTALLPSALYQRAFTIRASDNDFNEQQFVTENLEMWWTLLLAEWTNLEDKAFEAYESEEPKTQGRQQRTKDGSTRKTAKATISVTTVFEVDAEDEAP